MDLQMGGVWIFAVPYGEEYFDFILPSSLWIRAVNNEYMYHSFHPFQREKLTQFKPHSWLV